MLRQLSGICRYHSYSQTTARGSSLWGLGPPTSLFRSDYRTWSGEGRSVPNILFCTTVLHCQLLCSKKDFPCLTHLSTTVSIPYVVLSVTRSLPDPLSGEYTDSVFPPLDPDPWFGIFVNGLDVFPTLDKDILPSRTTPMFWRVLFRALPKSPTTVDSLSGQRQLLIPNRLRQPRIGWQSTQ